MVQYIFQMIAYNCLIIKTYHLSLSKH